MEALRLETGAQIDVPGSRDAASPSGRAEIKIKGSKKAVEDAKKLIEEKAKVFDNTVTRNLEVERKHHRFIIGSGGEFTSRCGHIRHANLNYRLQHPQHHPPSRRTRGPASTQPHDSLSQER